MTQVEPPTESPQIASPQTSKSPVLAKWKRRHLLIPVSLLVLVFVAGLLGFFHFFSQHRTPLTLAMVATLSGPNKFPGQESLHAVRLYIDQINQNGGVNGHPIQLQVFDDKFDVNTAQQVAH